MSQFYTNGGGGVSTPVTVPNGGTGDTSFTPYEPIAGGTTSTGPLQSINGSGATAGQVLTYVSSSALPTWQTVTGTPSATQSFLVQENSTLSNVTGDGTQYTTLFNSTIFDTASGYNPTTGNYTVPTTGKWQFNVWLLLTGVTSSHTNANLFLVTSSDTYRLGYLSAGACQANTNELQIGGSIVVEMNAGDTANVQLVVFNGSKVISIGNNDVSSSFSGFLTGGTVPQGNNNNSTLCMFSAYNSGNLSAVTGNGTIYQVLFDTVIFDQTSSWNGTTGTFVSPKAGYYLFTTKLLFNNLNVSNNEAELKFITSSGGNYQIELGNVGAYNAGGFLSATHTQILHLNLNEDLSVTIEVGGSVSNNVGLQGGNSPYLCMIQGYFIC